MKHSIALVWLRRDLRLADNPALRNACEEAERVIPVYVHAPEEEGSWRPGGASNWWLHYSLEALGAALATRGSELILRTGDTLKELRRLVAETGATLVTWNRLYEPAIIKRDKEIKAALRGDGIEVASHNAGLLFEPWTIATGAGTPYRVFTPFWRCALREIGHVPAPLPAPTRIKSPTKMPRSETLKQLKLQPTIAWDTGLTATWKPGEAGARAALKRFSESALARYPNGRNRPDELGTSRLSPHLHFGELSPRHVLIALSPQWHEGPAAQSAATEAYIRQLCWREFAHHLLFHFPHTPEEPLDPRFAHYSWRKDRAGLVAWQTGRTGYPLIDAGLRELWRSGWMHNRVRLSVASFLTKNLRIHWLEGARWFWDTLVDADLANNTLGWQWVAGCGADASPYYRIFNPVSQAEKFDPMRGYIRRWVPELTKVPDRWIHRPWEAPTETLHAAGVKLGRDYPRPMLDLRESRDAALQGYQAIRTAPTGAGVGDKLSGDR